MTTTTSPSALDLSSDLVVYAARLIRMMRREHDVPAGVRVLSLLDEHGPLGVTALAVVDGCSQPTMSAAVSSLVDAGMATKTVNPTDARGCVVTATDAGIEHLADLRTSYAETVRARLGQHSIDELAIAVAVLRDLLTEDQGS